MMTWIIGAILLGLILGVIGFYFRVVFVVSALLIGLPALMLFSDLKYWGEINILENLPEYVPWAGLWFVIFFFVARIVTWLLTMLNILPQFESDVDLFVSPTEQTTNEWSNYMYDGWGSFL